MTKSKTTEKSERTNVVSLQRGFPKRPESITADDLLSSAGRLVDFEMNYQRQQFASFTTVVTNLSSLEGLGVFKFRSDSDASEADQETNVVNLRSAAKKL